jgi:hypothetical protein
MQAATAAMIRHERAQTDDQERSPAGAQRALRLHGQYLSFANC